MTGPCKHNCSQKEASGTMYNWPFEEYGKSLMEELGNKDWMCHYYQANRGTAGS